MKKILFGLTCLLAVGFTTVSCNDDDDDEVVISASSLPSKAKTFLATHFPNESVSRAEQNRTVDSDGTLYEVTLRNGFEIDFDTNGEWVSVDGRGREIPASIVALLPEGITNYITANPTYNLPITEIDREYQGYLYKIKLANRLELLFSASGEFVSKAYDD